MSRVYVQRQLFSNFCSRTVDLDLLLFCIENVTLQRECTFIGQRSNTESMSYSFTQVAMLSVDSDDMMGITWPAKLEPLLGYNSCRDMFSEINQDGTSRSPL